MFKVKQLSLLLSCIAEKEDLFLPVETAGKVNFGLYTDDAKVRVDTLKTVKSGKDIFFPQSENLYAVKRMEGKMKISPASLADRPFVVFGMKGCDLRGLEVLDKVFMQEPKDSYYCARRSHGTIVAMACSEPDETCFCNVFGIDCAEPIADVTVWNVNGDYYWKPTTEKGITLTELVSGHLEECEESSVSDKQTEIRAIVKKLPYSNLSLDNWGGKATTAFDSPIWEDLYKPCLACGTCTFVCPTCQCYDIRDYNTGHEVLRYRCWDSCMYSDFTMMAHGNNRTSQMQRFRQRFMHKLVYFPENNEGMFSCTGCGRCVERCPQSLNIVKVIKAFEKEAQNG